jgi:hypothetical protein
VDSIVKFGFSGPSDIVLTENVNLPASEEKRVSVNTVLSAGEYVLSVESNTNDVKCINSIPLKVYSNLKIEDNRKNATLPTIAILSPEAKMHNNKTILLNLRATNATSVFYNWNGVNVTYTGPVYVTFNEGQNTLTAYAVNDITTASTSITFTVDTSLQNLPFVRIVSPEAKTYNNKTILVDIQTADAEKVWFVWDGVNVTYTWPVYITFNEGTNILTAYAKNINGTSSSSVTFSVNTGQIDTTPPAPVQNLALFSSSTSSLTWRWVNPSDADFDHVIVYINGVIVANTNATAYTATGLASDTGYTITLNTVDKNGNINRQNVSLRSYTNEQTQNNEDRSRGDDSREVIKSEQDFIPTLQKSKNLTVSTGDSYIRLTTSKPKAGTFPATLPFWLIIGNLLLLIILIAVLLIQSAR